MAQHISILNSKLKKYQKIIISIKKRFQNNLRFKTSIYYKELFNNDYKFNEFDRVFLNTRKINGNMEYFEIHYDTNKNKITEVFLVK